MLKSLTILGGALGVALLAVPVLAQAPATGDDKPGSDKPHHASFADLDTNHDGKLDLAEFSAPLQKRAKDEFDKMDANHDGVVTEAEFKAFKPGPGPDGHGPDGQGPGGPGDHGPGDHGPGGPGGPGGHDGPPPPPGAGPRDFKSLDTNGDGKVSFEEFSAGLKARFEKLDTNHDGVLEANELPQGPEHGPEDGPPPAK